MKHSQTYNSTISS